MRGNFIYVLTGAMCLLWACSREGAKPAAEKKAVPQAPLYSAVSIAPGGATQLAPLSPGRVVSIYGRYLGPSQPCHGLPDPKRLEKPSARRPNQTLVETQIFPDRLCDTEVNVGGTAAGLLYVSAGQINFKVPQSTPTEGEVSVRVVHKGQAGSTVSLPLTDSPQGTAKEIAAAMWSNLQSVKWEREYQPDSRQCASVAPHQSLRGGLYDHAFYCAQTKQDVIAESFYYPVDPEVPKVILLRTDIRPAITYPELSAEVEQLLIGRLEKAYGAPVKPDNIVEIGAYRPEPGRSWTTGEITIFLHRNLNHVQPAGVRRGVILIAVRREVLEQRRTMQPPREAPVMLTQGLTEQFPETYFPDSGKAPASEADRAKAADRTQRALFRLLRQTAGEPEQRAAALVAADDLVRRLGSLLGAGSASGAGALRKRLAPYGIRLGEGDHYSGDLTYDHILLQRAWKEYPGTVWGQRAFLMLQRLSCAVPHLGCKGPNCFLQVIEQGGRFLEQYPDTTLRREQTYQLALAYETWWSVSQAPPDDPTVEGAVKGAKVSRASGEAARVKAVELYEELLRMSPEGIEARAARRALPRLKLKLGTGERTFFCFSC